VKEAAYYDALDDGKVLCRLCPHGCTIAEGRTGRCGVRENRAGMLVAATYAEVTSVAMDPIEKKPLYHFRPGESILSLGGRGCNFACSFCQNWGISQSKDVRTRHLESDEAVQLAVTERSSGIAYTYNEPLIWFEYVLETARAARAKGLANVLVTNGYISPEPLAELLPFIDALNMDIKSIRPHFYEELCGGTLEPVLASARAAARAAHLEVTNLIIPGCNDSDADLTDLARWIADELGPDTPTHLSAYFPRYRLQAPPTPVATLERAYGIFHQRLQHVYLGNVLSSTGSSTVCHQCGAELIQRSGYATRVVGLEGPKCRHCGADNHMVR
jgi:pyruvate formate lyase activating enzyme